MPKAAPHASKRGGAACSCATITCVTTAAVAVLAGTWLRQQPPPVNPSEVEADGGRWVRRADGRLIEYFVCGDDSQGAAPLYWQHGFGQTARYEGRASRRFCDAAAKHGLRLIAPSQPSFGLSDTYPVGVKRTLADWPDDVRAVLADAGFDGQLFYAAGASAGCVHVAAVAAAMPDRVLGVAMFTPTAGLEVATAIPAERGGMTAVTYWLRRALGWPYIGDALAVMLSRVSFWDRMAMAGRTVDALHKMQQMGPEAAADVEQLAADGVRAVAHTWRGWTDAVHVLNDDLPFAPEALGALTAAGRPVLVLSAPDDRVNPREMQLWWTERVEGSEMVLAEAGFGHMHFLQQPNIDAMFARLVGAT